MTPVWEGTSPCWEAACDKCGRQCAIHFDTLRELQDRLAAMGWFTATRGYEGEELYCRTCATDMFADIRALREAWER